jgi:hypothetical protein
MEYTEEFNNLRNNIIIKHLEYKREYTKDENELNLIDLKIKGLNSNNKIKNKEEEEEVKFHFLDKIDNDFKKYALFKTWNRLSKEQKNSQIKIYLNSLIEADNIDNIKNIILQYVECGILTNKYITYDSKIAKVINIKCLKYNNENNTYVLDIKIKSKKIKSV